MSVSQATACRVLFKQKFSEA